MPDILTLENIPGLSGLGNVVPEGYSYSKKIITPGKLLRMKGAVLKWYDIYPPGKKITEDEILETRNFIESETVSGRLKLEDDLGFVILHRAGEYLLLMVNTWRNTNEIWESVYVKKADAEGNYLLVMNNLDHKATYCVWELGAVWHERNAWACFLESKRDDEAKLAYLNDLFEGEV